MIRQNKLVGEKRIPREGLMLNIAYRSWRGWGRREQVGIPGGN